MNTILAVILCNKALIDGNKSKVFDWNKAVKIIKDRDIKNCDAGLSRDLEWTSGPILKDGKPCEQQYNFLASPWAIPVIILPDGEEIECWSYQDDTEFDEKSFWPKSAQELMK